jgi:hypothetical protein
MQEPASAPGAPAYTLRGSVIHCATSSIMAWGSTVAAVAQPWPTSTTTSCTAWCSSCLRTWGGGSRASPLCMAPIASVALNVSEGPQNHVEPVSEYTGVLLTWCHANECCACVSPHLLVCRGATLYYVTAVAAGGVIYLRVFRGWRLVDMMYVTRASLKKSVGQLSEGECLLLVHAVNRSTFSARQGLVRFEICLMQTLRNCMQSTQQVWRAWGSGSPA